MNDKYLIQSIKKLRDINKNFRNKRWRLDMPYHEWDDESIAYNKKLNYLCAQHAISIRVECHHRYFMPTNYHYILEGIEGTNFEFGWSSKDEKECLSACINRIELFFNKDVDI
jgi:hypothetical protein